MASIRGRDGIDFTGDDLAKVRHFVAAAGAQAGLGDSVEALVIAVNEIAVNAVRYAGGHGHVLIEHVPDGLVVHVRDQGPGLPAETSFTRPPADALNGRGLWMAHELCTDVEISSGPDGAAVRLFMTRPKG